MLNNYSSGIVWPLEFGCTLFADNLVVPNFYSVRISLIPNNADNDFTDGLRKIRYFVDSFLYNSIFTSETNPILEPLFTVDSNLVVFPDEPYDYIVGSTLLQKFSVISKKYFDIEYMLIDSVVGDKIQYFIDDPEESGLDITGEFWWNQDIANSGGAVSETWEKLEISDLPKFVPKIIKGGRSEN